MCGRFVQSADPDTWRAAFDLDPAAAEVLALRGPRYNLAPTQSVLAIRLAESGRVLVPLRFGLVPGWSKGPDPRYSMINARVETLADKPAYRAALRKRRCLLPADGYYEWQAGPAGKTPFLVRRADRLPFAMAGLWERWQGPDGAEIESCTILTTTAQGPVAAVHGRMPVVLAAADYNAWLDASRPISVAPLLARFAPEGWELLPVSRRVNDPRNEGPSLIEPLAA